MPSIVWEIRVDPLIQELMDALARAILESETEAIVPDLQAWWLRPGRCQATYGDRVTTVTLSPFTELTARALLGIASTPGWTPDARLREMRAILMPKLV